MMDIPIEESRERTDSPGDSDNAESSTAATEDSGHLRSLQRLQADFDNYRKRINRERAEQQDLGAARFAQALLAFLDDFDRLLQVKTQEDAMNLGVQMIHSQLAETLQDLGLERFAQPGDEFDPHIHEAISTRPVAATDNNKIMSILQNGYMFKDKMLRPAQVEVGQCVNLDPVENPNGI